MRPLGSFDKCVVCGQAYKVTGPNQQYCPDCAPEAVKAVDRKQGIEYYRVNRERINPTRNKGRRIEQAWRYCAICGAIFDPSGRNQAKTCGRPECKAALSQGAQSAWEKAHRAERNAYHRGKYAEEKEPKSIAKVYVPPPTGDPVRDRILDLRRSLNLTRADLAEMLGVSETTAGGWEVGRHTPSGPAFALIRQLERKAARAGIVGRRPNPENEARKNQIIESCKAGKTVQEIATEFSVTASYVYQILKNKEYPARKRDGQKLKLPRRFRGAR